jgi:hypothetical protein
MMFFRVKTRPENAVGMVGTEVGALFRIKNPLNRWNWGQPERGGEGKSNEKR